MAKKGKKKQTATNSKGPQVNVHVSLISLGLNENNETASLLQEFKEST